MAIAVVASDSVATSSLGNPNPVSVVGSITYPATGNAVAFVIASAVNTFDVLSVGTATFDGNSMTLVTSGITASFGGGRIYTAIYRYEMGANVPGATVNYGAQCVNGDSATGIGAVAVVVQDCDQTTPVGSSSFNFSSSATSSSVFTGSDATSLMIDGIGREATSVTSSQGAGQTFIDNFLATGADDISGATSTEPGTGSTVTMSWSWSGSSVYTAVIARLNEDIADPGPIITSVTLDPAREPGIVNPTDTGVDVVGTSFLSVAAGPTVLYLADGTDFGTATKTSQTYSNLTDTTLDWDVSLGTFPEGDLYLFIVTDEGEAEEQISAAFPVIVSFPDVHVEMRAVPTVASGNFTENFDFPVRAVVAFVNGGTPDGTRIANSTYGHFFCTDKGFDGGTCIGSTNGATQYQREVNINVDGSVNILPDGNGANPSVIFGRISITGNDVNFTNTLTQTGYSLNLLVIGGRTAKADAAYVLVSDGSYTGTGFQPDCLFGATTGETYNTGGDTTFALSTFGVAVGTAAGDQWAAHIYHGTTTANKNSVVTNNAFCGQLNEGTMTWQTTLSSFDANGITWSGSNGDGMIIMMVNTDTLGVFATTVQKPTTATTQVLPDFGFTPSGIILASCTKTDQSIPVPSPNALARLGFGFGDNQGNVAAMHAIDGVPGAVSDAEMSYDTTKVLIIPNLVAGPALGIESTATLNPIIDSTPSIVWDNAGVAALMGVFGIEGVAEDDDSDVFAQMFDV